MALEGGFQLRELRFAPKHLEHLQYAGAAGIHLARAQHLGLREIIALEKLVALLVAMPMLVLGLHLFREHDLAFGLQQPGGFGTLLGAVAYKVYLDIAYIRHKGQGTPQVIRAEHEIVEGYLEA